MTYLEANEMQDMPKYLLIADQIKRKILNGELKAGDKVANEKSLEKSYSVSRITVRNALKELENQDLIYRVQGAGTFVKDVSPTPKKQPKGFELINLKKYSLKLVNFSVNTAKPIIAQRLKIGVSDIVFHVERLALQQNNIVAFQNIWLPAKVINNLDMDALERSIYPIVEAKINMKPKLALREFTIATLNNEIIKEFKVHDLNVGEPLLKCIQTSVLNDNQPFETTETLYRVNEYPIEEVVLA